MTVQFALESVSSLPWNHCPVSSGIRVQFGVEYANRGLDPWMDEENLTVGDHFNAVIKNKILETDYFIVVYSRVWLETRRGYIFRELDLALDVNKNVNRFVDDIAKFILPVRIDDSILIPDLTGIHGIDCFDPATFNDQLDKLTKIIKRDFSYMHDRKGL